MPLRLNVMLGKALDDWRKELMLRKKQKALSCAGALAVATFVVVALFSTASVQAKNSTFSTRSLGGVSCSTAIDQLTAAEDRKSVV